jgi:uncharacterized repeat protein (TIGR01451 family)
MNSRTKSLSVWFSIAMVAVLILGSPGGVQADPDLPGAVATPELIPAGSYIIPMDTNRQSMGVAVFNMKAYGLVSAMLHTNIPVKWAIAVGKAKDAADFSADVRRIYPAAPAPSPLSSNLPFFAGPFIVHPDFTNAASAVIAAYGNNVAVYQVTTATIVDVRYTLTHKPKVAVFNDGNTQAIHTDILDESGIPTSNYTVLNAAAVGFLGATSCYTFASSPHFHGGGTADAQANAVHEFVDSGGNFFAQCAAVRTYENQTNGHFHSTSGFVDLNDASSFVYPNPDMAPNQFQGLLQDQGGSLQDWGLAVGSIFTNNAYLAIQNAASTNSFRAGVAKHSFSGIGGLVFGLGGHKYTGTNLENINGRRFYMNAIFMPPDRPADCGITFTIDLELEKTASTLLPVYGTDVTFTLTLTNRGPNRATGVSVKDLLPEGLSYVSHSGGAYVPGTGIWTVGDLLFGSTTSLQITATATNIGAIKNFAQVWDAIEGDVDSIPASNAGTTPEEDDESAVTVTVIAADLELTKSVNNSTPNVGSNVVYTISVTNRGPASATSVTVADLLPAGLSYVSHSGGAYVPGTGLWTIGALAVGTVTNLQITATVTNSGNIQNSAQVQTADPIDVDSTPGNDIPSEDDQDDAPLTVPPAIDLELTKSVDNATPNVGGTIVYTLVVTNRGLDSATGVTVADVLPAGLSYVTHSGLGTYVPGTGVWTLGGPMTPGSGRVLSITALVTASGSITNDAQVQTAGEYDIDSTPGNATTTPEDDDDEVVITVAPSADLELTKSVNNGTPNVGDSVIFTIGVTNRGPDNATGVAVEDVLPSGLGYVSDTGGGAYVNGSGIWTIGALAVGGSTSLQITAAVTNSGNIENIAQIETANEVDIDSTPDNDVPSEDDQDNASLTVPAAIDLELDKSVSNPTPAVGGTLVYTLVLTNRGPNNATGVTVADVLPAGMSYVSFSGPGTYVPGTGVWTLGGPMTPGSGRVLSITALVTASGSITNDAQVQTAGEYDTDSTPGNATTTPEDDDDRVVVIVPPSADLELIKSVNNGTPNVGDSVIFTIGVTNRGPDNATGVTVEDVLPSGLAYVSDTGGGAYVNGSGIWTIGALAVGGSTSLQITAAVTNSGNIENIAQVQAADQVDIDSTPGNDVPSEDDQDNASLTVPAAIDLELDKSVSNPTPAVGGTLVYTLVLTNRGPNNATGVTVADVLPAGMSYVSFSGPGTYVPGTGVWTLGGPMTPGSGRVLSITALVTASGSITNDAQVQTAGEYDTDSTPGNATTTPEDDDDRVVVIVPPSADLELIKSVNNGTPNVGDSVIFTIGVTNRGPDNATGVTVEDVLPSGLAYVSDTGGGAYVNGSGIWTLGALAVGGSTSLQITATVTNSGTIENIAQVQAADQVDVDSTPDNDVPSEDDQDNASLTVPAAIDLELDKSVNNSTPSVGGTIIYTLVLTNRGPDNATGVTVADVLPSGLGYVSHSGPGTYMPGTGLWALGGPMTPGSGRILSITASVTNSGTITNAAQVQAAGEYDVDSTPGNAATTPEDDDDEVLITVAPSADLELIKSVNNSTPNLGDNVVFTIGVTNRGPDNASSVTVEDVLPAGLAYVSDSGGGAYMNGTGIWTLGALAVGNSTSLQITATVTNTGSIDNTAQVETSAEEDVDSTPGNDVPTEDDQDNASLQVPAAGDLELDKSVNNAAPNVGDTIVYTVVVTNRGPDAQQTVSVQDVLPSELSYVTHSGGLYDSGSGIWNIGNLNSGSSTTLQVSATVNASGAVTNYAQIWTALHYDIDSTPSNAPPYVEDDDDFVVINTPAAADLELLKSVDDGNPNLLGTVVFTVLVTNRGPDNATGVTVEDVIPAGLTYVSDTGAGAYVNGSGIWTLGGLNVGATTSLLITATVNNTGLITNLAQVATANEYDIDSTPGNDVPSEDDQDNAFVSVGPAADLELVKSVNDPMPNVGDTITFTVAVSNSGPNDATGVLVEDVLPAGLGYVTHSGGAYVNGTGLWTIGGLAVGSSTTLTVQASVDAAGVFTNIAQVNVSDQYDPDSTPDNDDPLEDDQDAAVVDTPQADLELEKSVDNGSPNVTENVIFTIAVTNRGPDNATGVTVEDILPAGLLYVSDTGGGDYETVTHIWTIGGLAVGETTNLMVTATVTNSGLIENIAQIESADQFDVDSTPANDNPQEDDQDNAVLDVPPATDLELTKTVDNPTPAAGNNVNYTVTVTNRGPDEGEGISVKDVLPSGVSYVSHLNGAYIPVTGIWNIGDLAVGSTTSLTITVKVDVDGVFTNVAEVETSDHFDPDSTPGNEDGAPYEDEEDEAVITASPIIDLELLKSVDKAEADPFENVVWTLVVTNKGPSTATSVTVLDALPTNWVTVSDSSGAYDTNTSIWTIGTLPANGSTSLAITAYATLGVTSFGHGPVPPGYTNVAQVLTAAEPDIDSTPGNDLPAEDDQDDAFIPILALSDLALTKTVDQASPYLGSQIAYTVVVTNQGPQPAVGVLIEDVLPAGLTYVSNSVGSAYTSGTGIWDIGLMVQGWSRTLTIWATVDAIGSITNIAQVNDNEHFDPDSTPDNDLPAEDDQDEVVISGQPLIDLELDKIVDKAEADPFENVVWTLTVTNKGPSDATGLTVFDALPTNWVTVSDSSGAYDTNTSIWTIGTLPANGSTSLAITAYATLGVTSFGHGPVPPGYTNVAQIWTANEDDVDSTPGNDVPAEDDQDDAFIPILALSDLALTKSVDNASPYVGSQIAYTVVVTNEGPQPAVGVLIEDVLPTGLTYVSNSVGSAYTSGTGIWDIGLMVQGWSRTLTIWATVDVPGVITNIAQVNDNEHFDIDSTPDNDLPAEDDQDDAVINGQPLIDLELDKIVDKAEAAPFENVVWTLTVTNKGPSDATGLTVFDALPTNWVTVSDSSGTYDTNTSIWTIGTLPANGSTSLAITAYATLGVTSFGHGPVPPGYTNVAQVWTANEEDVDSTPGNDLPAEDDQDDAFIPILALSDLALTKTVDQASPYLGSQIAYTVVVTNQGPQPAVGVLIEDVLPAGLTYVSNSVGSAYTSGTGIWDIGLMVQGWSRTLTIWATVDAIGSITNIAQVNDNEHFDPDSTPDNDLPAEDDQDQVVINGQPLVDVELDKIVDKAEANPFENVVWTLTVTNKGPSDATGLTVFDALPTNWIYVSDSSGTYDTNTSIWTLGTLPVGGSTSLAITAYATLGVTVSGHGPVPPGYTNVAQVWTLNEDDVDSTPGNDIPSEDDQDDAFIPILAFSDLALTKTVDNATPNVGQQIAYTVVVTNEGPQPAVGVLIEDVLPVGVTYVSNSVGTAYSSGTGIWDIGLMVQGWSRTLTIWATVDSPNVITNIAQVNDNEHYDPDSTPDNDVPGEDDQDEVVITPQQADLELTKGGPTYVLAGGTAPFTIVVTNNGPDAATGVTVEDVLPFGMVYSSHVGGNYNSISGLWAIGNLAVGSSTSLQVVATVTAAGLYTNVAQVETSDQYDPDSTPGNEDGPLFEDDEDIAVVTVVNPAVQIIKTAGDVADGGVKVVVPGDDVVFVYQVTNQGDTYLTNLVVTDDILGAVGTIAGPLAPASSATLSLTSAVPVSVTNIGTVVATPVTAGGMGMGLPNVTDSDDAVVLTAYLSIEKEDLPDPVRPGGTLAYTLWVSNPSDNAVEDVVVTEQYPSQFSYVAATPAPDSGNNVWALGTLNPGALRGIVIRGTVSVGTPGGTILTNRITVTSTVGTNTTEEPTLVVNPPPPEQAAIRVTKRDLMDPVGPGSNLVYAIRVENFGPATATNVIVTETYDPLFTFVGAAPAASSGNNSWNLGDLAASEYREIVVSGVVSVTATDGTMLTNRVAATADNAAPSDDDEITLVVSTTPTPPEIFKTASTNRVMPGQTLIYTITVQNASAQVVSNATVVESYDSLFRYGSSVPAPVAGTDNLWDLGDLAPGSSTQIVITGVVLPNFVSTAVLFNTAELISDFGSRTVHLTTDAVKPASLGDFVWLDEDWNGIQDAGEAGISNVRLELLDSGSTVLATTMTDINGFYLFAELAADSYIVRVDTSSLLPQLAANQTYDPDATLNSETPVTLIPGDEIRTADFGYNLSPPGLVSGAIGDRVWVDENSDGIQDVGEPGIPNVTVRLYVDSAGNGSYNSLVATTTTDAAGLYVFSGLDTGSYVVRIVTGTLPPNYTQTGDPDTFGTSMLAGTGDHRTTTPVVLAPGDVFVNADFGYWFPYGSNLGDLIYFDANADGVFNMADGDYGIEDVTVVLLDGAGHVIASAITGHPDGLYLFTGLPAGTYTVWVNDIGNVLDGRVQTGDPDGGLDGRSTTTLDGVNDDLNQDHGYTDAAQEPGLGIIGDSIFLDRDGNTLPGIGEGIQGAAVNLYDSAGTVWLASTLTDPNGHYYFSGLAAATYVVRVDTTTLPGNGAGMVNTADPDTASPGDSQSTVVLAAGEVNLSQDFGYVTAVANTIAGTLWKDCNADGILDSDETPRWAEVTVFLRDSDENIVSSMRTDANGNYSFNGLPDGTYTLHLVDHANVLNGFWHSVGPNPGMDNNSQMAPYTVTVTGGEVNSTGDFGYYLVVAELGDYIWYDINDNGLQDGGEPGLANVRVRLRITYPNGDEITMETRTDSSGHYVFANLLLDERYSESTMGDPSVEGLPRFQLSVDASQSILTAEGYEPTQVNVGNASNDSRDTGGIFALLQKCGRPVTYDFGFRGGPLLAVIGNVDAFTRDGQTIVRWESIESWGTTGFWLERQVGAEWVRISDELLPFPIFGVAPIIYEEIDPGAVSGGTYLYRLVELENDGDLLTYGPYQLTVDGPGRTYEDWAAGHFTPAELADPAISGEEADPDGDGLTNHQEFLAGTDPHIADVLLQITGIHSTVDGLEVNWNSIAGRSYHLAISDTIFGPFLPLDEEIIATGSQGRVTLTVGAEARQLFFQVIQVAQE